MARRPVVIIDLDNNDADGGGGYDGETCKSYFLSPKEWKMIVIWMTLLGFVRIHSLASLCPELQAISFWNKTSHFRKLEDIDDIRRRLEDDYCSFDAEYMCPETRYWEDEMPDCIDRGIPSLAMLWTRGSSTRHRHTKLVNCTMETLLQNLAQTRHYNWNHLSNYPDILPISGETLKTTEHLNFVILMVFSWMEMNDLLSQGTVKEKQRLVEFYTEQILFLRNLNMYIYANGTVISSFFVNGHKGGWTTDDFIDMMFLSLQWIDDGSLMSQMKIVPTGAGVDEFDKFKDIASHGLKNMMEKKKKGENNGRPTTTTTTTSSRDSSIFYKPALFLDDGRWGISRRESTRNSCMAYIYGDHSFITETCTVAMDELAEAVKGAHLLEDCEEITYNGSYLLRFIYPTVLFCLYRLFGDKERIKRIMDRRRQSLQTELDDPVLRESLFRRIPEESHESFLERRQQLIANWDSKTSALRQLRPKVRKFRIIVMGLAGSQLAFALYVYLQNDRCPLGGHWDALQLASLLLLLSYKIPLRGDEILSSEDENVGTELMLDESTTRPLLLEEENDDISSQNVAE